MSKGKFPLLANVARMLLGMPATSIASERVWSETKLNDTRLRTSMGDEVFADLVFIAKNLPDSSNLDSFLSLMTRLAKTSASMQRLFDELDHLDDIDEGD